MIERLLNGYIPEPNTGCWLWEGQIKNGYACINDYSNSKKGKKKYAHRVMYEYAIGPTKKGMHVCHKCGTPQCINPAHLYLGTPKQNADDARKMGRTYPGSKHWNSKLSEDQVKTIREEWKSGQFMQKELAEKYRITTHTVWNIVNQRTWNHLQENPL